MFNLSIYQQQKNKKKRNTQKKRSEKQENELLKDSVSENIKEFFSIYKISNALCRKHLNFLQ